MLVPIKPLKDVSQMRTRAGVQKQKMRKTASRIK